MKKSIIKLTILTILITGCTGCSKKEQTFTNDPTKNITKQLSSKGVKVTDDDYYDSLEDNTYYVYHKGKYYPLNKYECTEKVEEDEFTHENNVDENRKMFYPTSNGGDIPTLFPGDKLMYFSKSKILDYCLWERYQDLGYTVGLYNLKQTTSYRYYIDVENTDTLSILANCELSEYSKKEDEQTCIEIDKIGGIQVNSSLIQNGIFTGLKKNNVYNCDIYIGTQYYNVDLTCNYQAFQAMEIFASIKYKTLKNYLYEIEIPEYFTNGYYSLNNAGLVRIVKENNYSDTTSFNHTILSKNNLDLEALELESSEEEGLPCYSEEPRLNHYVSKNQGTIGYKSLISSNFKENEEQTYISYNTQTIPIKFNKNICSITVLSPTKQKDGAVQLKLSNGKIIDATYNDTLFTYNIALTNLEENQTGEIIFTGFSTDYNLVINGGVLESSKEKAEKKITNGKKTFSQLIGGK